MTMRIIAKPGAHEFQANEPLFGELVPGDGHLLDHMQENILTTRAFILAIPIEKLEFRYAVGKWTIKEILIHLADMERIYSYRMLCFARNEKKSLPGFDDMQYVFYSSANKRSVESLLDELVSVRAATIELLQALPEEALLRSGTMNGYPVTVRAMAYHIAGHELHHLSVIKEKYLV